MAWYSTGTVSVTNGSKIVTGAGTSWFGALQAGWGLVGPDGRAYEIAVVNSATQITLKKNFLGSTASGQEYAAFPTMSLAHDLVERLNALIAGFQSVKDEAGAGKFGDGSLGAPGIAFLLDQDTGLRRPSSNEVSLTAGGVDQLSVKGGAASGAAVQSGETDGAIGKLLKVGAFGLGSEGIPREGGSVNALMSSGAYYGNASAVGRYKSVNGYVIHNSYSGGQYAAQIGITQTAIPDIGVRTQHAGDWSNWAKILTDLDVQASATDATPDSLMKVGAFGIGSVDMAVVTDFNALLGQPTGFYKSYGASNSPPLSITDVFIVEHMQRSSGAVYQKALNITDGNSYERAYRSGAWTTWRQAYHQGNILGTVSQSGGVPTGAIVERGSNGNGEYVRFADGTQICVSQPISLDISAAFGQGYTAAATATWTYPAAFAAAPAADAQCKSTTNAWGQCTAASSAASVNGKSFSNQGIRDFTAYAMGRWF